MKNKCLLAALAAVGVFALEARTFEVAAWRGETVSARVPDYAELAPAPAGFVVRYGVLKSVKYAPSVESLQRLETFDRVAWGCTDAGPRVVEITVPVAAKPGVYDCGNMKIRVVDRVLPPAAEWKYFLDLWQHPWAVSRFFGVKPFSDAHYAKMRPVWELLASAGQKTLTVSLLEEPWDHQCFDAYHAMIRRVRHDDGTWSFDYSLFDAYVKFGRACGLAPKIGCYTMCPWGYLVSWLDDRGTLHREEAKPGSSLFASYWGPFLADFKRHLVEKGWFDDAYIAMDERSPEDMRIIVKFIQDHAKGMRISLAGNLKASVFDGIVVDNYCQSLSHLTDEFLSTTAPSRRAKGQVTTFYVCCGPTYPNTFMSSAAGEAFWLGAFPAMCGLDGFLRWAWNSWPNNPNEDATYGQWRPGDTFLCYPNGEPSWRFLELRNGIVAAEKIRILKESGALADDFKSVAALYKYADAIQNKSNFVAIRKATLDFVNK